VLSEIYQNAFYSVILLSYICTEIEIYIKEENYDYFWKIIKPFISPYIIKDKTIYPLLT